MKFKPGKIIDESEVDGKKVIFRYPKMDDLNDMVSYINKLVKDREYIGKQKPVTKNGEEKWLKRILEEIKTGKKKHVVVEIDGKIVGNSSIEVHGLDATKHCGNLNIGLSQYAQNKGIGTRLMKTLIEEAKELNLSILQLTVFGMNERAKHVYEKVGFKYVGKIPNGVNYYGKYGDHLIYYMEVPE